MRKATFKVWVNGRAWKRPVTLRFLPDDRALAVRKARKLLHNLFPGSRVRLTSCVRMHDTWPSETL